MKSRIKYLLIASMLSIGAAFLNGCAHGQKCGCLPLKDLPENPLASNDPSFSATPEANSSPHHQAIPAPLIARNEFHN